MLPSISYDAPGQSLFDAWATGSRAHLPAPLAVSDPDYQQLVAALIERHRTGPSLISVGAGIGRLEAMLARRGLDVVATDVAPVAVRHCAALGLTARRFDLMRDPAPSPPFDVVYCDGVLGHLWTPARECAAAWTAMSHLGRPGSMAVVSNDLADTDDAPQFAVRADPKARFYRPPAGTFGRQAIATGRWMVVDQLIYTYSRAESMRRREVLVARLLMNDRVEAEDPQ